MNFSSKELRGKNTMLDRIQRQQDVKYEDSLKLKDGKKNLKFIEKIDEPLRSITKAEIGKKRSILR